MKSNELSVGVAAKDEERMKKRKEKELGSESVARYVLQVHVTEVGRPRSTNEEERLG